MRARLVGIHCIGSSCSLLAFGTSQRVGANKRNAESGFVQAGKARLPTPHGKQGCNPAVTSQCDLNAYWAVVMHPDKSA